MSGVRASCWQCRDVDVPTGDVTVVTCGGAGGRYWFECPKCGGVNNKPASEQMVDLLRAAAIRVVDLTPEGVPSRLGPLRNADVIGYATWLNDAAAFHAAVRALNRGTDRKDQP